MEYLRDERFVFVVVWGVCDPHTTKMCATQILWRSEDENGKWLEKGVWAHVIPRPGARGARNRR